MPNSNKCMVCNKSLVNKRPHAITCSGYCRTKLSRMSRAKPISLKLVLSKFQFESLKAQADHDGVLLNQLVLRRALQPLATIGADS